jgi:hypothetical protein
MLEQNLIGLDDAEVGVVGQNDVVNRIEGVDPLPLRAQHLLEQAEVLDRDRKLLGAGLKKVQFFCGPAAAAGTAQQQQSDRRFVARDRDHYNLANSLVLRHSSGSGPAAFRVVTCGPG